MHKIFIIIFFSVIMLYPSNRVTNYSSTNKVNQIAIQNDQVIVLTGGGLFTHDLKSNKASLLNGSISFPDPNLTAFSVDDQASLWVGSQFGYLARWEKNRWGELSKTYQAADWKIRSIISYASYLFVGASSGVSLFDTKKMRAEKSAVLFSTLTSTQVNALIIHKDNLYVGLENGLVRLDSLSTKLEGYNFFDPLIWKIDSSYSGPVKSFVVKNDSLHVFAVPTVFFNGTFLSAQGTQLVYGEGQAATLPSDITCLTVSKNVCWIGTESDYYYKTDGITLTHYSIPGPTFTAVNRLTVDNNGELWVVPTGDMGGALWWKGFQQFDGNTWRIHNNTGAPSMGGMPENPESKGLTVSRDGSVWIGTSGAHLKRYMPSDNSWSQFCTFSQRGSNGLFFHQENCSVSWAKTDAVAQDSSGYMWINCWDNPDGSLICYDPRFEPSPEKHGTPEAHYRRFFPKNDPNNSVAMSSITVDAQGHILIGNLDPINLTVLQHNGDPISSGVNVIKVFDGLGIVSDAVSVPNGMTYLLTGNKGLCEFDPINLTLKKIEKIGMGISAIEIEDENTLWLASEKEGLIRYSLNNEQKTVFSQVEGFISLNVRDLAIDRENGYLWVATDQGISRLALGLKAAPATLSDITVFPVPFSKERHTTLFFNNVPVKSKVSIFSTQGQLIANALIDKENSFNSSFSWIIPQSIVPGAYYYSIYGNGKAKNGKLLITP